MSMEADKSTPAPGQHCPGCRGYTRDWEGECPGVPGKPPRIPLDMAGHRVYAPGNDRLRLLDGLCHCRLSRAHRVDEVGP